MHAPSTALPLALAGVSLVQLLASRFDFTFDRIAKLTVVERLEPRPDPKGSPPPPRAPAKPIPLGAQAAGEAPPGSTDDPDASLWNATVDPYGFGPLLKGNAKGELVEAAKLVADTLGTIGALFSAVAGWIALAVIASTTNQKPWIQDISDATSGLTLATLAVLLAVAFSKGLAENPPKPAAGGPHLGLRRWLARVFSLKTLSPNHVILLVTNILAIWLALNYH